MKAEKDRLPFEPAPTVSVIVPTLNSHRFLQACLESVKNQTYPHIELIVVDNNSTDDTKEIASKFTDLVFNKGPERSAQVNFGVQKASGEYVYKVDSDFLLDSHVVQECVLKAAEGYDAVVVHNTHDVSVGWIARIRKFEVDMYKYNLTHSSARFVKKSIFTEVGGFNGKITDGEDYDFQNKLNRMGVQTGFIDAEAIYLGEPKSFIAHMRKFFEYGKDFIHYHEVNESESKQQLKFGRAVYIKNWRRFIRHPALGVAFTFYHIAKYTSGGLGYAVAKYTR